MRKLIVQQLVTAAGFVAGPDGGLDFFDAVSDYAEVDEDNLAVLGNVDRILLGRRTYEMFVAFWPGAESEAVADAVNTIPKLVFSRTLSSAPWGDWDPARVERRGPADIVAALKREPGADIIVWGSISLCHELAGADLVDEYQFRVCPVTIGHGIHLFGPDYRRRNLTLAGIKRLGGIAALTYVPRDRLPMRAASDGLTNSSARMRGGK